MNNDSTTSVLGWLKALEDKYKNTAPPTLPSGHSPYYGSGCPSCGYCQHCGRGGRWNQPWTMGRIWC